MSLYYHKNKPDVMATYIEQQLPSFITDLFKMQLDSIVLISSLLLVAKIFFNYIEIILLYFVFEIYMN
jgi:hypothetical protein